MVLTCDIITILQIRQPTSIKEQGINGTFQAPPINFLKKNFFNVYLFLEERETECRGEGRERVRQNLKQASGSELSV